MNLRSGRLKTEMTDEAAEYTSSLEFDKIIFEADIKSKLVALLNSKKDATVVDNVQPHYGEPKALGYAKVYDTVEDLEYIETKSVIAKNTEASEEAEEDEE